MQDYKFHEKLKKLSGYVYKKHKYSYPKDCIELDYEENKDSGFYASAFYFDNQIIIVFRGTDIDDLNDINADLQMVSKNIPNQIIDAKKFYKNIKNTFPNKKIIFTGHSLGGSIAQIMSYETNCDAVTFAAYGTRKILSTEKIPENVINYGSANDPIYLKNLDYQYGKTYIVNQNFSNNDNKIITKTYNKIYQIHNIDHFIENIGNLNNSIEYKTKIDNQYLKANLELNVDYKDIDSKRIFTAEEIGKLSNEDFQKFEKYIDKQLKEFGIPRENQVRNMVLNGNLIWVDDYKRNDGTPVKGYYRRK